MSQEVLLDVRKMIPRERHPRIFKAWEELPVGGSIKLVNDHNPKPLFYEFKAERTGEFEWRPLEEGPERWVVAITRVAAAPSHAGRSQGRGAIRADQTVRKVAEQYPQTQRVFAEHGLDMCCGGEHPIETAAAAHGVALEPLMEKLNMAVAAPRKTGAGKTHSLDVRGLEAPEPMVRILSALPAMGPEDVLDVTHFREPFPLYAHLEEAGFAHSIEKVAENLYRLKIRKKSW